MRSRSLFEPKASLNGFTAHSQPVADPSLIVNPLLAQAENNWPRDWSVCFFQMPYGFFVM